MQIVMDSSKIEVGHQPNGNRVLKVTDIKSGVEVVVPLPPEVARTVGQALATTIAVANAPLPAGAASGGLH